MIKELGIALTRSSEDLILSFNKEISADVELNRVLVSHPELKIYQSKSKVFYLKEKRSLYDLRVFPAGENKNSLPKSVGTISIQLGSTSQTVKYGASVIFIIFSLLSMDPSGIALEFNQFLDLVQIYKLFGFRFGSLLGQFIDNLSGYEPKGQEASQGSTSSRSSSRILSYNLRNGLNGSRRSLSFDERKVRDSEYHRYKFEKYQVAINLRGILLAKTAFYLLIWVLKLIGIQFFQHLMNSTSDLKKWQIKLVVYLRQIHFIGFGLVLTDLCFFNTRILLHRKNDLKGSLSKVVAMISSTLLILDCVEIFNTAVSMRFERVSSVEILILLQLDFLLLFFSGQQI